MVERRAGRQRPTLVDVGRLAARGRGPGMADADDAAWSSQFPIAEGGLLAGSAQFNGPAEQVRQQLIAQGMDAGLAEILCGPIAASGLLRAFGLEDDPGVVGRSAWDAGQFGYGGMAGAGSMQALMSGFGLETEILPGEDGFWTAVEQLQATGKPFVADFPLHYMLVQDLRQRPDGEWEFFVGTSGSNALAGGADWMTLTEMNLDPGNKGAIQNALVPTRDVTPAEQAGVDAAVTGANAVRQPAVPPNSSAVFDLLDAVPPSWTVENEGWYQGYTTALMEGNEEGAAAFWQANPPPAGLVPGVEGAAVASTAGGPTGRDPTAPSVGVADPSDPLKARAYEMAREYGVDPLILDALVTQESGWDTNALGDNGNSHGLLQANQAGGRGVGHSTAALRDPEYNLRIGLEELAPIYKRLYAEGWRGAALAQELGRLGQRPQAGLESEYAERYNEIASGGGSVTPGGVARRPQGAVGPGGQPVRGSAGSAPRGVPDQEARRGQQIGAVAGDTSDRLTHDDRTADLVTPASGGTRLRGPNGEVLAAATGYDYESRREIGSLVQPIETPEEQRRREINEDFDRRQARGEVQSGDPGFLGGVVGGAVGTARAIGDVVGPPSQPGLRRTGDRIRQAPGNVHATGQTDEVADAIRAVQAAADAAPPTAEEFAQDPLLFRGGEFSGSHGNRVSRAFGALGAPAEIIQAAITNNEFPGANINERVANAYRAGDGYYQALKRGGATDDQATIGMMALLVGLDPLNLVGVGPFRVGQSMGLTGARLAKEAAAADEIIKTLQKSGQLPLSPGAVRATDPLTVNQGLQATEEAAMGAPRVPFNPGAAVGRYGERLAETLDTGVPRPVSAGRAASEGAAPPLGGVPRAGDAGMDDLAPAARAADGGGAQPASRRMYHGTGSDFETPDGGKFDPNGLFGPGYYLTSDPRVAGSYADALTGPMGSGPKIARFQQEEQEILEEIASLRSGPLRKAFGPADSDRRLAEAQVALQDIRRKIAEPFEGGGPNIRAVDVPENLRLLDMDKAAPDELVAQARKFLPPDSTVGPGTRGEDLYRALTDEMETFASVREAKKLANRQLQEWGYDGIAHQGGQNVPLMDDAGTPIEHAVTVIFPESLPKIRNALSGRAGGGYIPPGLAENIGGAAAGGAAGSQADEDNRLGGTALGLVAGALGGPKAAQAALRGADDVLKVAKTVEAVNGTQAARTVERAADGRITRLKDAAGRWWKRMYSGTAEDFVSPSAAKMDPNGLGGPAYYMTDTPRVSDAYAAGREKIGNQKAGGYGRVLENERRQLAEATTPEQRAWHQTAIDDLEARQAALAPSAGQTVRIIDVPEDLRLFDFDAPADFAAVERTLKKLPPAERARLEEMLGVQWTQRDRVGELASRRLRNDDLYDALVAFHDGDKAKVNKMMAANGVDGIRYKGGQRMPLKDDAGNAVEHEAYAIFEQALPKIKNALSGKQGGSVNVLFALHATAAGGGALGGNYLADQQNADPLTRVEYILGGLLGGAILGNPRAALKGVRTAARLSGAALKGAGTVYQSGLVSAPITPIRNVAGMVPILLTKPLVKAASAAWDVPVSIAQGRPRGHFFREIPVEIKAQAGALGDAFHSSWETIRRGVDPENPFVNPDLRQLIGGGKNPFNYPFRAATAGDVFFSTLLQAGELRSLAYRHGRLKGLRGADLDAYVQANGTIPDRPRLAAAIQEAKAQNLVGQQFAEFIESAGGVGDYRLIERSVKGAKYATFNQEMDAVGRVLTSIQQKPGGKFFVPFVAIPYNIAKWELAHSPAGLAYATGQAVFQGGHGAAVSERLGRATVGSAAAGIAYLLYKDDKLTGRNPFADGTQEQRDLWLQDHQEYSIWSPLEGKWRSYALIPGFALNAALIVGADQGITKYYTKVADKQAKQEASGLPVDPAAFGLGALAAANGMAKAFKERSFIDNFADTLDVATGGKQIEEIGPTFERMIASAIPNVFARAAQGIDPTVREPQGIDERLRARSPFHSQTVPSRLDSEGQPLVREQNWQDVPSVVAQTFNPMQSKTPRRDPTTAELVARDEAYPRPPEEIGGRPLTRAEQREYQRILGQAEKFAMDAIRKTPEYQRADAATRKEMLAKEQSAVASEVKERQTGTLGIDTAPAVRTLSNGQPEPPTYNRAQMPMRIRDQYPDDAALEAGIKAAREKAREVDAWLHMNGRERDESGLNAPQPLTPDEKWLARKNGNVYAIKETAAHRAWMVKYARENGLESDAQDVRVDRAVEQVPATP